VKLSALSVALSLGLLCSAHSSPPIPGGMRHAQELEAQNDKDFPLPRAARSHISSQALQREAAQLADLAASIPPDVQNVSQGLMDKDLVQKLKQIEKLSKHLRNELDR